MDTRCRIEKAFHDQTQFLSNRLDQQSHKTVQFEKILHDQINRQTQWIVGLIITMTVAIIVAVLFKGA